MKTLQIHVKDQVGPEAIIRFHRARRWARQAMAASPHFAIRVTAMQGIHGITTNDVPQPHG